MLDPTYLRDLVDSRFGSPAGPDLSIDAADTAAMVRDRLADARDAEARDAERRTGGLDLVAERARRSARRDRWAAALDRARAAADRNRAHIDATTGVIRRDPGTAALMRLHRRSGSFEQAVVAFVDVDGLKEVNDSLGHRTGDAVLRTVADTLTESARHGDLIIRYGGDEFLVGAFGTTITELTARLTRAALELHDLYEIGISFGAARAQEYDTLEDTIERADSALYATRRRLRCR